MSALQNRGSWEADRASLCLVERGIEGLRFPAGRRPHAGAAAFTVELPAAALPGIPISATATSADGSTSEFSQRIVFAASPSSGPAAGGTPLALSGTNFLPGLAVVMGGSPADFAAHLKRETAKWARVIKDAGIKAD